MERFRLWVKKNITGDGTSQDFSQSLSEEKKDVNLDEWIEIPDTPPDAPTPGENPVKYLAEFFGSFLEGIGISALIGILKHIIEKQDNHKEE